MAVIWFASAGFLRESLTGWLYGSGANAALSPIGAAVRVEAGIAWTKGGIVSKSQGAGEPALYHVERISPDQIRCETLGEEIGDGSGDLDQ